MPESQFRLPQDPDQTCTVATMAGSIHSANQMRALPVWSVAVQPGQGPSIATEDVAKAAADLDRGTEPHTEPAKLAGYRLLQQIGKGGMGEVWEAEQTSLGRLIAVKRLRKRSEETPDRQARELAFRNESVIAASLEHPNILPVYDLGQDDDGALLLAMKRVHGQPWNEQLVAEFTNTPVDQFLAHHLPILIAVVQAVAFAHSRGIIHRDLKPAQVMVGAYGEVLLTDWGLAIHTGADAAPQRSPAQSGAPTPGTATNPAGTPSLMAPEQTDSDGSNLGPWTDVYLLGGTLYFLLTGSYPHAPGSSQEVFERARSGHVETPSRRAPGRFIPPELEQLCLRALEPGKERRLACATVFLEGLQDYQRGTARKSKSAELSSDVEQSLAGHELDYGTYAGIIAALEEARRLWPDNPRIAPLRQRALLGSAQLALQHGDLSLARVQCDALEEGEEASALRSAIEQRQRTSSRRQALLRVATAAVCALLLVIAVGALLFSSRMQAANAEIALRAEEAERALAIASARGSGAFELINYVLKDLKSAMDEELTTERGITMDLRRDIAHAIAGKVASPVVAYFERAEPTSWPENMQLEHAGQMHAAGKHFRQMARRDEALKLLAATLSIRESLLGPDHAELTDVLQSLSSVHSESGRFEDAEAAIRRAIGIAEARLGTDHPSTAMLLGELANLFGVTRTSRARLEEAEALYRRAVDIMQRHDHPMLSEVLASLGKTLNYLDNPEAAEPVLRRALDLWETTHEADDPDLAYVLDYLATSLRFQNRLDEAEALQRRALGIVEAQRGPEHPDLGWVLSNLSNTLSHSGRVAEAEALQRRVIAIYEKAHGADHFRTGREWLSLGFLLHKAKRLDEAETALRRAVAVLEKSLGPDYLEVGWGYQFLGFVLKDTNRPREARAALEHSIRILTNRRGPDHNETNKSREALVEVEAALARQ